VVIVHGNQDNNAKATVLWDNAFSEIVSAPSRRDGLRREDGSCRGWVRCCHGSGRQAGAGTPACGWDVESRDRAAGEPLSWCPPALLQDRVPFVVAERVPWEKMCDTLNLKFMAEVQTTKGLLKDHYFFLAQKIFNDHNASLEDFQSRNVSWAQFNKVTGRAGQGGAGACMALGSLTPCLCPRRSCLVEDSPSGSGLTESLTSPRGASKITGQTGGCPGAGRVFMAAAGPDLGVLVPSLRPALAHSPSVRPSRLIIGFISKQYVCRLLSTEPDGTFLLRFSDSEIGGVTIAHVIRGKDGEMGTGAALGDAKGRCHRGPGTSGVVGARRWTPVPCLPTGSSQVENIQPFSAKDLSIRSLGDRIRDLGQLRNLYPNTPKDQAFGSHYNSEWVGAGGPRASPLPPQERCGGVGGKRGAGSHPGPAGPGACRGGQRWHRGLARPRAGVAGDGCFSPSRRADGQGRPGLRLHRHQDDGGKREVGVRVRPRQGRARGLCRLRGWAAPGRGARRCWAGGFQPGRNGDVLLREESPVGTPSCSGARLRASAALPTRLAGGERSCLR